MYVRVTIKCGIDQSSQIMPIEELNDWIKSHSIEGYVKQDAKITFSKVKKSPLWIKTEK